MPSLRSIPFAIAVCALFVACDARQAADDGGAAALTRNLALARAVEIHVDDESAAEPMRRLAALERARTGRDVRVLVRAVGDPDLPRIVVGTSRPGPAATLAVRAGVTLRGEDGAFRVADLDHEAPEDAACFTYADPDRRGLPITVWLGNDLARLLPQVESASPRARPSFRTWRGGDLVLRGELRLDGSMSPRRVDRVGIARLAVRGLAVAAPDSDGFRVEVAPGVPPEVADRVRADLERARERANAWAGGALPRVSVRLVAAVEDLRLGGESDALGRWNRARPAADMLVLAGVDDGGAAAVRAGLRARLGPAVVPWIEEGASVAAARSWWGRDLERWLARLAIGGSVPSVATIVDPRSDARISRHVLEPARALLFDHLLAERGPEHTRALWTGTRALDVDAALEASFTSALDARVAPFRAEVAHRAGQRRAAVLAAPPAAGVVMAESESDPRSGFGSGRAQASLAAARAIGARAVSLDVDFAGARIDDGWPVARDLAPTSGDLALFATATVARHHGMRVTFATNVLASDAGSYAGTWTPSFREDWAAAFEEHARAVEHAALLAGLSSVDWLSIGSSLFALSDADPDARRARPEEIAWRRDGWNRVIGAARGAFPGGVTYTAGDALEAERIGFWGDLDAIGLQLDPRVERVSPQPRVDLERRLRAALESVAGIAERTGRPVLLARATFARVLDRDARAEDAWTSAQIDAYSAAIRAAVDEGLDVRGAWLERVGTDPRDRGANARDPLLDLEGDASLPAFFAGADAWVREGSRAGERSPR